MISGSIGNVSVNKIRNCALSILLVLLWCNCVTQVNKSRHRVLDNSTAQLGGEIGIEPLI